MLINFLPDFITLIGELLIGYSVITVHKKISKEHKIDKVVINEIREESHLTYLGIIMLIAGYSLEVYLGVTL